MSQPWDPASEEPRPDQPYQPPGPSFEPPTPYGDNDQPQQTVWSPVESGPRPAYPSGRRGTGPDWQQTAEAGHHTPLEPTLVVPAPVTPVAPAPPQRRKHRRGLTIGVIVLAVLVLLVAADRATAYVAGRRTASELANSYGLAQAPSVHFGGFPFLNQLATSHYRKIDVSAQDIPIKQDSSEFTISKLDGTLQGVRWDDSEVTVDSLRGTALLDYGALSELMGQQVSYAGRDNAGGRIKIELTAALAVTAGLDFNAGSKKFQVRDVRLDAGGQSVPAGIIGPLINRLMQPVSELPDGIELDRVDVTADGLRVHGNGSDLVFPR
jgi:hypothetical protein